MQAMKKAMQAHTQADPWQPPNFPTLHKSRRGHDWTKCWRDLDLGLPGRQPAWCLASTSHPGSVGNLVSPKSTIPVLQTGASGLPGCLPQGRFHHTWKSGSTTCYVRTIDDTAWKRGEIAE
eukprot:3712940-Rhodomonas_salina.1